MGWRLRRLLRSKNMSELEVEDIVVNLVMPRHSNVEESVIDIAALTKDDHQDL
jgi:hypothetical protein